MVRTKRPQWQPLAWRSGASSGTVTVVARISTIFMAKEHVSARRSIIAAYEPPGSFESRARPRRRHATARPARPGRPEVRAADGAGGLFVSQAARSAFGRTYDALIRMVSDWGLEALDTTVYWFPDTSDRCLAGLRATAYKNAVSLPSIAVRVQLCQPTAELQKAECEKVRKWVDVAEKLGCRPYSRVWRVGAEGSRRTAGHRVGGGSSKTFGGFRRALKASCWGLRTTAV